MPPGKYGSPSVQQLKTRVPQELLVLPPLKSNNDLKLVTPDAERHAEGLVPKNEAFPLQAELVQVRGPGR
ncbi:MAG: hypothetical protein K0S81_1550 [Rhodospirillales bacterium]|nr:hypothetical protein [Rhodospirillales bacterium]